MDEIGWTGCLSSQGKGKGRSERGGFNRTLPAKYNLCHSWLVDTGISLEESLHPRLYTEDDGRRRRSTRARVELQGARELKRVGVLAETIFHTMLIGRSL